MYQAVRGTSDILPVEQPYWRYVAQAAAACCRLYGYRRLDSPTFEETGLFTRSVGEGTDIVEKEMYTFEDKGGKSLTLRPEGTASVCRAYLEHGLHNLPQPVRLYYLTPIFRYERPQAGRLREHHQFGCEAIGDEDPALDAEVIDMAWSFFRSLGLAGLSLHLNSIGCKVCRPAYLAALKEHYAGAANLCRDCRVRIERNPLRLLDCKEPSCQDTAANAPRSADHLCPDCREHFARLQGYLGGLEIPYNINHRLVRGLDYYTRTVFEIQPEEAGGAQSALGGGGRYDDLIGELGGKPTAAIGFGTGIERIVLNLKRQDISVPTPPGLTAFIAHTGGPAGEEAVRLAALLRQAGIGAVAATGGRSLKAQLRQANSLGVRHTVILGEEELRTGTATVRDMAQARQVSVALPELPAHLQTGR